MIKLPYFLLILTLCMIISYHKAYSDAYWQQYVRYQINVRLNTDNHTLSGITKLTYKNNSPDTLSYVWFHLYPNAYKDRNTVYARESLTAGSSRLAFSSADERGYIRIDTIRVNRQNLTWIYKDGDETEMKVTLPAPLKPKESLDFYIKFFVKIPHIFSRLGHLDHHYECTQWYPKIVVYDKKGWHPDGYHRIGEFYGEFGKFEVEITVPKTMIVAATGELTKPKAEILWLDSLANIGAALDSLRATKNNKARKKILNQSAKLTLSGDQKTLKFYAENVHDFVWVADQRFILKRGRYKNVTINIFVLPQHEEQGRKAIEYTLDILEHYGKHYLPYPYHQISVVDGGGSAGGGMEYPTLAIINFQDPDWFRYLELVITHEVGHNWFYGILGNNEMDEAWLDEGMNSFAEIRYMEDKYGKNGNLTHWPIYLGFLPQLSDRYVHSFSYYLFAANQAEQPILTPAHQFKESYSLVYSKAAWMMDMLRNMLGHGMFDEVMQTYCARYQFKHPTTEDFIAVVEEISHKDWGWFFDQWLKTTHQCDLAIKKTQKHKSNTGLKQFIVTVEQRGNIFMPADLLLEHREGSKTYHHWHGTGRDTTFQLVVSSWPKVVWIDPDDKILEVNNWNNRCPRKISFRPFFDVPAFDQYQIFYRPSLWYEDDVDGLRTGLYLSGGQFRDWHPLKGFYQWSLTGSYAFESEKFSYSFSFRHPLPWLGNYARFELQGQDLEGQKNGSIGLNWRWSNYVTKKPRWQLQVRYFFQNVYDLNYVNAIDYTQGITSGTMATICFEKSHYRFPFSFSLTTLNASNELNSDFDFNKVSIQFNQLWKWSRKFETNIRCFGGYVQGHPAKHHQFFLSGGLTPDGPLAFIVDRKGRYSPQNYYFVEGDGSMCGYYRQHVAGRIIGAVNLRLKLPYVPIALFYDIGNIWNKLADISHSIMRQDAGFRSDLGPVQLYFPIWVSHPRTGEKEFNYRWLISLRTSGFSISF